MRARYIREEVKLRRVNLRLVACCGLPSGNPDTSRVSRQTFRRYLASLARSILSFYRFLLRVTLHVSFVSLAGGNFVEHVVWLAVNHVPTMSFVFKVPAVIARGRLWMHKGRTLALGTRNTEGTLPAPRPSRRPEM